MTKKSQVIFMSGKEKALKALFSNSQGTAIFGYLAIGYGIDEENGFEDPDANNTATESGFKELPETNDYHRIPLSLHSDPVEKDGDTGKVLVKFTATLDENNIKQPQNINQIAVVDNAKILGADTKIYSATTFPTFQKTQDSSITFVIGFRL